MICVGHSHMLCVLNAAQEAGIPFQAVTLKAIKDPSRFSGLNVPALIDDGGTPDFRDDTKALFSGSDGPIFAFVGGIKHVHIGLRRVYDPSEAAFDFVLPEAPHLPLEEGAEIIPFDAVRQVIQWVFSARMTVLQRVTRLASGPVFEFAPPPPVSDRWITSLVRKHAKGLDAATVPSLPSRVVRWKLWRLTTDVFREHAESFGARFVDYPPESVDADGFMREELVQNFTHGNQAFGALVLDQIRGLR